MPYPNFHACRISNPDNFQENSFRNITSGKGENEVQIVIGRKKGETVTSTQSIRYPIKIWTKDRAERHCKDHNGRFEPAS